MSTVSLFEDSAARLAAQADAIGRLAQDPGAFAAAFAAFEARDPDAFRWVLDRGKFLPRCELICEWIEVKLCALRCFEVCGPPIADQAEPTLPQFAEAIVRLSQDEQQLRRVVDAVACGDAEAYSAVVTQLKLTPFCHLICRWVCSALYRRFCEIVCTPLIGPLPDPVNDLRVAAKVLAAVIKDEKTLAEFGKVATTLNCEKTRAVVGASPFFRECEIICWVFCVWRCGLICRKLCIRPVDLPIGVRGIEEARAFALAAAPLASQPRVLFDLVTAVQAGNADLYGAIVEKFRLSPFCFQLCGWVCSATCSEFCICICHNVTQQPWFTTVGYFDITSDIDAGTGKTNKSLPYPSLGTGGGPNYAFTGDLQLGGFCPATSPNFPGVPMKYRFRFDNGSGPVSITGGLVSPVPAGTRLVTWPSNVAGIASLPLISTFQDIQIVEAPAAPDTVPPALGFPWVPPGIHQIAVDPDGWVEVDPNAIGGGFQTLLGFHTPDPAVLKAENPNPQTPGVAVAAGAAFNGADFAIIFEATRTTVATVDFTNSLAKIHINNATETNALDFAEFGNGCCTPIDKTLTVEFTVDHEEMDSGTWSIGISSCSNSAPPDITPTVSGGTVTLSARGGFGTILEDTSTWANCSYTVTLNTRPGLTTGLVDRGTWSHPLTFAICSH